MNTSGTGGHELTPEGFFTGSPAGQAVQAAVAAAISAFGAVDVRVSKSQVAFRRRRGFAYLWRPGAYVKSDVPAVLSLALGREVRSSRIKEVAHPSPKIWMHHLELREAVQVDGEVKAWLREAYDGAA